MQKITIEIPDEFYDELKETAEALDSDVAGALTLAYQHFSQTEALDSAIEGIERSTTSDEDLIEFTEIKEELDIDLNFHPLAMEELTSLEPDDQVELIGQLIERLSQPNVSLDGIDIILKDGESSSLLLSSFEFGDIVYRISDEMISIYHLSLLEDLDDENFLDDEDEDDDFDDDEYEEIDELGDDEFEFGEEEDED